MEQRAQFTATVFPGQQEDERILYVIEPHMIRGVAVGLKLLLALAVLTVAFLFSPQWILPLTMHGRVAGILISAITCVLYFAGSSKSARLSRTFITDRRVVRFERSFPFGQLRRALFWTEVTKAKAFSPNYLLRMLKVGTIEIRAKVSLDEGITIPYAWYFDDVAAYIDKILHLTTKKPDELQTIHPFVPKPKGKRYPYEPQNENTAVRQ